MSFLDDDDSDIGGLWSVALDDYAREAGTDLRHAPQFKLGWTIGTIITDQEKQLAEFSSFRHNKSKLDKFRSIFARNADIIQAVAAQVATAASAAFPPASALLTAFTYVMAAGKGVSDDYDMIESFFDSLGAFLERLSLLDGKIPPEQQYKAMLIRCFSAILHLSAIARGYRKSGRFSKWAKHLVDGQDPKLQSAYALLQKHLSRLESGTLMATFRQTLVISKDVTALSGQVQMVGSRVETSIALAQQSIGLMSEGNAIGAEARSAAERAAMLAQSGKDISEEMLTQIRAGHKETMMQLQRITKSTRPQHNQPAKGAAADNDPGAAKATNMAKLRAALGCGQYITTLADQERDFRASYVPGTFGWIEQDQAFEAIIHETSGLMWISGEPGMGKTTLLMSITDRLQQNFEGDASVSICRFCIREDYPRLKDMGLILRSCAQQAAEANIKYRDQILTDITKQGTIPDEADQVFELFFLSRFSKDSGRRAIIILDGADELEEMDHGIVKDLLRTVADPETSVQIIFSSGPSFISPDDDAALQLNKLELSKDRIRKDMWKVAVARTKALSRLRKLRPEVRKKIATRLRQKADNIRYIEHMTRRLNALGAREGLILRELDRLPDSTEELYKLLVSESQRHRTPEELAALRTFFGWLAYAQEHVSLGAANRLLQVIASESGISIDEELDGKSARLLRLANSTVYAEHDTDSSDIEIDDHDEEREGGLTDAQEDLTVLLGFQERSLRRYFKNIDTDENGLRSSANEGHRMIFETIVRVFLTFKEDSILDAEGELLLYSARFWKYHISQIKIGELDSRRQQLVIEHLHSLLDNKNNSLRKIVQGLGWPESETPSIFGEDMAEADETLRVIQQWSKHAVDLSSTNGQFSNVQEWFRPLVQTPARIYIVNSRHLIVNWFGTSENVAQAFSSYRYAYESLRRAYSKGLPELQHNEKLREHFEDVQKRNDALDSTDQTLGYDSEEAVLLTSNVFWDVPRSYRAHWSIAMTLKWLDRYETALSETDRALEMASTDKERVALFVSKGHTLYQLSQLSDNDGDRGNEYLKEACGVLESAIQLRSAHSVTDVDEPNTRDVVARAYQQYALAEFRRNNIAKMETLILEATGIPRANVWYGELLLAISHAEKYGQLLDTLKLIPRLNRAYYFAYDTDEPVCTELHIVATQKGEALALAEAYIEAIKVLDQSGSDAGIRVRLKLAELYAHFIGDSTKAKQVLYDGLNFCTTSAGNGVMTTDLLGPCIWQIVGLLVEEFRATASPTTKTKALDELKSILRRLSDTLGEEYRDDQSQANIPRALMTRKLGPTIEYAKILQDSFDGCVVDLTDSYGMNDMSSLRMLAKVLACVEGLESEAQIAASCQFSVLDMDILMKEMEGLENEGAEAVNKDDVPSNVGEGDGSQTTSVDTNEPTSSSDVTDAATSATMAEPSVDGLESVEKSSPGKATPHQSENSLASLEDIKAPQASNTLRVAEIKDISEVGEVRINDATATSEDVDGDLNQWLGNVTCNGCDKAVGRWSDSAIYLCLLCVDMDICGDCFAKKERQERGEEAVRGKVLCPAGHRHVKAPIEGWRGVKDGIIRVGKEEIAFDKWLKELKDVKWPRAWAEFWMRENH